MHSESADAPRSSRKRPHHQGGAHGGRAPAKIVRAPAKVKSDGTRDRNTENVSVAVQYVKDGKVHEELIGMLQTDKCDAESMSLLLLEHLDTVNLKPANILSQCYDGASVMSGGSTSSYVLNCTIFCVAPNSPQFMTVQNLNAYCSSAGLVTSRLLIQ